MAKRNKTKGFDRKKVLEKISYIKVAVALLILIALILVVMFYDDILPKEKKAVAVVNGESITEDELNEMYGRVPELYKTAGLTKERFLEDSLIPYKLLLQEASKRGITAGQDEVNNMVSQVLETSGMTQEEFNEQLRMQNVTYEEFMVQTREQIVITKLLNESISSVNITDSEVKEFYDSNKELFQTGNNTYQPFSEAKDRIGAYLANKRFMEDLMKNSQVQILLGEETASDASSSSDYDIDDAEGAETAQTTSFKVSQNELCAEDGKPLVILFSTTTCPHCKWIKNTFDKVAKEYSEGGKISAYHWEMDTGDNTLTPETESSIPDEHADMFWSYSPKGGVPTFVFGCKYYRVGNAYESQNDLEAEERDFRNVIGLLLGESI